MTEPKKFDVYGIFWYFITTLMYVFVLESSTKSHNLTFIITYVCYCTKLIIKQKLYIF